MGKKTFYLDKEYLNIEFGYFYLELDTGHKTYFTWTWAMDILTGQKDNFIGNGQGTLWLIK